MLINYKRKAFTITELVIVIGVIAILAAVLVPTYTSVIDGAEEKEIVQEAKDAYNDYISKDAFFTPQKVVYEADGKFISIKNGGVVGVFDNEQDALDSIFVGGIRVATDVDNLYLVADPDEELKKQAKAAYLAYNTANGYTENPQPMVYTNGSKFIALKNGNIIDAAYSSKADALGGLSVATTDTDYLFNTGDGKLFMYYKPTAKGLTFKNTGGDKLKIAKAFSKPVLTFEAWIKCSKNAPESFILGGWCHDKNTNSQSFVVQNGNPRLNFRIKGRGGVDVNIEFTSIDVRTNDWVHLALVIDTANRKTLCYINGVLKSTTSTDFYNPPLPNAVSYIGCDDRYHPFDALDKVFPFKGYLHSVAVYTDVRTPEEIMKDCYAPDNNADNLMARWVLPDSLGSGGTVKDLSGNGYTATRLNLS